ncbi:Flagellar FliJ protein [Buchnera aphidicola (Cinara cf. splendens/pseudotsugae 3390)]|uniref:Flagellar FliJ protein n=2 Tax=Buchnera aphidicola TaxID=9 RepID=A0A451CWB4_9GAMM|nr:Flagellar FliJ protein [Buchnera aphidicola (Cinara cf. splendens/pseudotsugae 3390)]
MIYNISHICVLKKKIKIDIKKNTHYVNFCRQKIKKIQQYLLQLHKYYNQYNVYLYEKFFLGSSQYIIKVYIQFLLMLKRFIFQQHIFLNYFENQVKNRLLIHHKLYLKLEIWKKLELRIKNRIVQKKILTNQREDSLICSNIYNFLHRI